MEANHNYDPDLKCCWLSWQVRSKGRLDLTVARTNSTDMTGAIAVAQRLMPTVTEIHVFNDWGLDIIYRRGEGKTWQGLCCRTGKPVAHRGPIEVGLTP
jgi:hypothetical protein